MKRSIPPDPHIADRIMITHPNSLLYACISKSTTILADFDPNVSASASTSLLAHASHCLSFTPPHHSVYSHTVSGRTYHFLIDADFVYFGIFDDVADDPEERVRFLKGVKEGFDDVLDGNKRIDGDLSFRCFQDEMYLVFRRLLELGNEDGVNRTAFMKSGNRNVSSDSSCSSQMNVGKPLLGHREAERKVEVAEFGTNDEVIDVFAAEKISKDDIVDDTIVSVREKKKVRRGWRTRVGLVLLIDLLVCSVLFVVWLLVCQGFKCLAK